MDPIWKLPILHSSYQEASFFSRSSSISATSLHIVFSPHRGYLRRYSQGPRDGRRENVVEMDDRRGPSNSSAPARHSVVEVYVYCPIFVSIIAVLRWQVLFKGILNPSFSFLYHGHNISNPIAKFSLSLIYSFTWIFRTLAICRVLRKLRAEASHLPNLKTWKLCIGPTRVTRVENSWYIQWLYSSRYNAYSWRGDDLVGSQASG
jgi:hypothetical protein